MSFCCPTNLKESFFASRFLSLHRSDLESLHRKNNYRNVKNESGQQRRVAHRSKVGSVISTLGSHRKSMLVSLLPGATSSVSGVEICPRGVNSSVHMNQLILFHRWQKCEKRHYLRLEASGSNILENGIAKGGKIIYII